MANNSVQRLYDIIIGVRKFSDTNVSTANAFASVLGIENLDNNYSLFYQRISVVHSLISFSNREIQRIPGGDKSKYIEPIDAISKAMSKLQWETAVRHTSLGQIPPQTITALEFAALRVTELKLEKEISGEDIKKLLKGVNELIQEVMELEDLPEDLKTFVLERLDSLRFAIEFYRYAGYSAIATATDALVFGVGRYQDHASHRSINPPTEASITLFQKVCIYASSVYTAIEITNNIVQLLETISKKLIGQ